MLKQIARGLATLHAHGVIHRDLKPGNVLVPNDGPAKIADFGISRLAGATNDVAAGHADTLPPGTPHPLGSDGGHTRTGVLMGTPLYMAPELAKGAKDAQPPSDVFAFGLIAYELLTGVRAWDVPPVYEAMAGRALVKPAPIHSRAAAVPVALGHMLDSCLASDPGARPDAAALAAALTER